MNVDERAAALVTWWVQWYTRHLPEQVALDRQAELACDLWEERAAARDEGRNEGALAASTLWRAFAGIPADLTWRYSEQPHARMAQVRHASAGRAPVLVARPSWQQVHRRLRTRRCRSCGQRYERRQTYCPVCKAARDDDIINRRA